MSARDALRLRSSTELVTPDADIPRLENLECHGRGVDQVPHFVREESEALTSHSLTDVAVRMDDL